MNDVVERVARAIHFATNPLDGDPIGVMIHNYEFLQADTVDEQIKLVDEVCAVIARAAIEEMPLRRLLQSAKLLYANAVGCAQSHYGDDFSEHGMPGWLVDCQRDIDALSAALADASPDIGKEGIGNDV